MNARDVPTPVLQAFALLGRYYRNWVIDESVIASWWGLTSDLGADNFLRAAIEHSRISKFPPTPADLIELADKNRSYRIREKVDKPSDNRKNYLEAARIAASMNGTKQIEKGGP